MIVMVRMAAAVTMRAMVMKVMATTATMGAATTATTTTAMATTMTVTRMTMTATALRSVSAAADEVGRQALPWLLPQTAAATVEIFAVK